MIEDRWEAIRWAIGSAQTDDCVVIVGRGHKDYVDWVLGDEIARVSSSPSLGFVTGALQSTGWASRHVDRHAKRARMLAGSSARRP